MRSGPLASDAGLSLVEIMVALFIVGLTSSFVILSIPRSPTPLHEAQSLFEDQVRMAREAAMMSGSAYGVALEDHTLNPLIFRNGEWQAPPASTRLLTVQLPEAVELERTDIIEPRSVAFSLDDEPEPLRPDIWFDPSGIAETAVIEMRHKGGLVRFSVQRDGGLDVIRSRR